VLRLGGEKTTCSGLWIQKHAAFAPASQKRLDSRLRSPLPLVEEPCPLSLPYGFFTHKPSQNNFFFAREMWRVFELPNLNTYLFISQKMQGKPFLVQRLIFFSISVIILAS
jgi:hypothetical protein